MNRPPPPGADVRATFAAYRNIAGRLGLRSWPAPWLVALGLVVAVMEALAVGLVVALLFALLSPEAPEAGRVVQIAARLAGDSWSALALLLLALVAAKAGLSFLYAALSIRSKNEANGRVLKSAHAVLLDMSYADLRSRGAGELINVAAADSWQVANAAYLLTRLAVNVCTIAVFSIVILALSWQIAVLATLGGLALALLGHALGRLAHSAALRTRIGTEKFYTRLLAAVHGARLVRAFGAEPPEKARVGGDLAQLRKDFVRTETIQAALSPTNEIGYLALLIALVVASFALGVPHAESLTAIALLYRMSPQIKEFESNRLIFASLAASLRGVAGLLDAGPNDNEQRGRAPFDGLVRTIQFRRVSLAPTPDSRPALRDASFTIPAGQVTALVGPSGAGKTSVVNLLLRLYEPDAGEIRVGGSRLADIDRATWLDAVAAAGQDLEVIEGTIADNLRLAAPFASDADLRAAAHDAGALDFIEALPSGFDSWVGLFGYNLSGGQRQRLSLARALLRKPSLLILDEGTSAIETTLEAEVLSNVLRRCRDATVVLISHRLSAAVAVDHVIELESGSVRAEGGCAPDAVIAREVGA